MEINICPEWLLQKLRVPAHLRAHTALFFSSILVLGLIPFAGRIPHFCLMQRIFGLPCPGCGILHSISALLDLDLAGAARANPAGVLVVSLLAFQIVFRPIAACVPRCGGTISAVSIRWSNITVVVLLLFWVWKVLSGGVHVSGLLSKM